MLSRLPHPLLLSLAACNIAVFSATSLNAVPSRDRRIVLNNTLLSLRNVYSRPWVLLTHIFSHANAAHLAMNTLSLLLLAPVVLNAIRPLRFAGLYLSAGVVGGAAQLTSNKMQGFDQPSLGASGALAGVLLFHCVRVPLGEVVILIFPMQNRVAGAGFVAMNIFGLTTVEQGGGESGIAYGAHLGGAAVGAALAPLFRGRAPPLRFRS